MRVTDTQADLLRAMQRGVKVWYDTTHGYWYRGDTGNRVGAVAGYLARNGLAYRTETTEDGHTGYCYRLTDAGQAWRPPTTETP